MSIKDYRNAISLAIAMDQPGRLLTIFKTIFAQALEAHDEQSVTGSSVIDEVLRKLPSIELTTLLRHARDWNANGKTSAVAQNIMHAVFKLRTVEEIINAFETSLKSPIASKKPQMPISELVQSLIPYTERHLSRMDRLVQESYILDYILSEMDGGLFTDEGIASL